MNYVLNILIVLNIYIILTSSTNLIVGMSNLLSVGQAALYGTGAYIAALFLISLHWSLIPLTLVVMAATSAVSLLIAYPSIKLRGDYFILATFGFQIILFDIMYNWVSVTKGPYGISGIPSPLLFGLVPISGIVAYFLMSTIMAVGIVAIMTRLIRSPFGRALRAAREDELSAESLGRNVTELKIWAFVLSSAFIGIAGLIYASYISYIDPTTFNLDQSIFILSAIIIGGSGNVKGPIYGAIFVVFLPQLIQFIGLPDNVSGPLREIIYGLTIVVLMRLRPRGIAGEFSLK